MTEFRRTLRYHQARWREANGHPVGSQPIVPRDGKPSRPVGSRLPLDYARETGANFLTAGALEAARGRTSVVEPHQTLDHQRLWADLLWSPAMAFNIFGDLAADLERADRAVDAWWPNAPGTVSDVRFAHSPGRLDPEYLNSLRAFDAAFVLDVGDGTHGIVGVDVTYHERLEPEIPKPSNMWRYLEVAERSGVFRPAATDEVKGRSELCVMWLEHLLLLSMLQYPRGAWSWGRYVVVHPADNSSVADGCARYRDLLVDQSTFSSMTLEELLAADVLRRRRPRRSASGTSHGGCVAWHAAVPAGFEPMVAESKLEKSEHGLAPKGGGWYILNMRDAEWRHAEGRGAVCVVADDFEGWRRESDLLGVNPFVLMPGEPMAMYHWEADQEDFLVVAGEAVLIVEGEERQLRAWDFVHSPPHTTHVIVGAGSSPCLVIAVGARAHDGQPDSIGFPADEVARRHGASVEEDTTDGSEAYASVPPREPTTYRDGWLPE